MAKTREPVLNHGVAKTREPDLNNNRDRGHTIDLCNLNIIHLLYELDQNCYGSKRAASASAERPSLLIPSLLRDREFLALAPPGSQHSPSRDFFEESPRLVVFHEGDETMKECHEFEDERVHFGFVCMVKRLQMDEAVLDSSLLPQKLVSAVKNEHC
nr:hypothetical protein Iba_chr15cCG3120 [Ipomoea batatas]